MENYSIDISNLYMVNQNCNIEIRIGQDAEPCLCRRGALFVKSISTWLRVDQIFLYLAQSARLVDTILILGQSIGVT